MTYKQLYDHCQRQPLHVKRGPVRAKVIELTGRKITVVKTTLDVRVCRGMYFSAHNATERIVQQLGTDVVVLAREGNNFCWERFVEVKEYMHAFDSAEEATDSGERFDRLLAEFTTAGSLAMSDQMTGEIKAFWRAMGALCPEHVRQELIKEQALKGPELSNYAIALRLRIPEQYVPHLFEDWYLENQSLLFD